MKTNDLVKYLTVQVVSRIDQPKKGPRVKERDDNFSTRWFGLIPLSLRLLRKQLRKH